MRYLPFAILLIFFVPTAALADEPAEQVVAEADQQPDFEYVKEAELPEGWPAPGPIDVASVKVYPEYRAAYAEGDAAFWLLFSHIQSRDIPMTTPVEMAMDHTPEGYERVNMGFLYQSTEVGETGEAGAVEVIDVPAMTVVSFGTHGPVRKTTYDTAIELIEAKIETLDGWRSTGKLRMLGYNSPMIPREKQYFEIQVILEEVEPDPGEAEQVE
ncbi:MAG: heme-binding protein [Planctomycetota bacterium]